MPTDQIIKRIFAASSLAAARKLVRQSASPEFANAAFSALLAELGTKPQRAKLLADALSELRSISGLQHFGHRARAISLRLQGKWLASVPEFEKAGEFAPAELRALFSVGAIDSLARAGRSNQATKYGADLYERSLGGSEIGSGRVALNTGHAFSWYDNNLQAAKWYERAIAHFRAADSKVDLAQALVGKSTSLLGTDSSEAIFEVTREAISLFEEAEMPYYASIARMNLATAERLRGNLDVALSELLKIKFQFEREDEEAFRVLHDLAAVYAALNLHAEAEDCALEALSLPWAKAMPVHRGGCWQEIATARINQGNLREAKSALSTARRIYSEYGDPVWVAEVNRIGLSLKTKWSKSDRACAEDGIAVIQKKRLSKLIAPHFVLMAERGDERALRALGKLKDSSEEWKFHLLSSQRATGAKKRQSQERMLECIWRDRLKLQSRVSLMSYLDDKVDAIQSVVADRLSEGTEQATKEAIQIIVQARSIALVDEVLRANSSHDQELLSELENLRTEFAKEAGPDATEGKRKGVTLASNANLQRRWTEASMRLESVLIPQFELHNLGSTAIYLEAGNNLFQICNGTAARLKITKEQLTQRLRWLHFELGAPGLGSEPDHSALCEMIAELQDLLQLNPNIHQIAPEGIFWSVPWQALCQDSLVGHILLPGRSASGETVLKQGRVVIWAQMTDELPHVRAELEGLLEVYPDAEVCTSVAQARDSLNNSEPIRAFHVAAHGHYRPANPMLSSIEFEDGELFAAEISRSPAQVDLAVLAACHSGALSTAHRFEPNGLCRAFLALGAKSVFAGQWAVDDQTAPLWTSVFHKQLKNGKSAVYCTQSAQNAVKAVRPHPYFWASIIEFRGYISQK